MILPNEINLITSEPSSSSKMGVEDSKQHDEVKQPKLGTSSSMSSSNSDYCALKMCVHEGLDTY